MGRPIGSVNRQRPFADALRMEICAGNDLRHLRAIARKLIEMAEGGDLQAIKEVGDRLDGKCAQTIERGDVSVDELSDAELYAIIRQGSRELLDEPSYAQICGPVPAK
ncbi:hypothetical protein [Bradyrhizobium sp.]|uniref:hypothetical protein n=1 Tax=Bradyrhizobium sp. TaxID=376 RepID=UPI003BAE454A